jgi:hypothetical protein
MENRVLASLENSHGDYCVDIFVRPDGWRCLNRYSSQVLGA